MTPGRLYPSVQTVPLPVAPDAGRKHFLYRAGPGGKAADPESGFSENKHQKMPHFPSKDTPYTILAGPVRALARPTVRAARIPQSHFAMP